MSDTIIKNGQLNVNAYTMTFSAADDLLMPFSGTLVIPRSPAADVGLSGLDIQDWLVHSLLHPLAGAAVGQLRFPSLRGVDNQIFTATGKLLALVDQDHSVLEDFDFGQIFSKNVFSPTFPENMTSCSRPKVILIALNEDVTLPEIEPVVRDKGFALKDNIDTALAALRSALTPAVFSGTIYAFDTSGRQVESYAALLNLNLDKTKVEIAGRPPANEVRVQFVDLHGNVLMADALPVQALQFTPGLSAFDPGLQGYRVSFGANRELTIRQRPIPVGTAANEEYKHKFIHLTYWPGHGFEFVPITTTDTTLNLMDGFAGNINDGPSFLRLCVFHPEQELQTTAGGDIDKDGLFKLTRPGVSATNKFKLYHENNEVRVFNDGQSFFRDFFYEVMENSENGELKEMYVTNWKSSAHLHLRGSMRAYGIAPGDQGSEVVDRVLTHIDGHAILCELVPHSPKVGVKQYLLLTAAMADRAGVSTSFFAKVSTLPEAGQPKGTGEGFIRADELYALRLKGEPDPLSHQVRAVWKNSLGVVDETVKTLSDRAVQPLPKAFPDAAIALETDNSDPPNAVLKRKQTVNEIRSYLSSAPDAIDLSGKNLQLLVLDLEGGRSQFVPIDTGASPDSNDLELAVLPAFLATDSLAIAVVDRRADDQQNFAATLLTSFHEFRFGIAEHANAQVPFHREELGGLLRDRIAAGVKVKAMYWEQFLENIGTDEEDEAGHTNNVELTALINRTIQAHRGHAVLDRATRPFGSFHQKGIVLIKDKRDDLNTLKKVAIAYLGGIDLATGRWDTEEHYTRDPDRQGGQWFDVQMKITGEAALDVLRNFEQRWEALDDFIDRNETDCIPRNPSPAIAAELQAGITVPAVNKLLPVEEPDTFLQITRTIPPAACHASIVPAAKRFVDQSGEDGSLQSFRKAIQRSRKFLLINDQYFFSVELALELHQALRRADGPQFAVIVLPKNLNENEKVDPLLFKTRQQAIQCLYYGGTDNSSPGGDKCGRIRVNDPDPANSTQGQVALLFPRSRAGTDVYVHSKHLIVDDVFMIIGSSNVNYRSMSYDWELNAAAIGRRLYKGGTDSVRNQRIDICRRLLGLPKSFQPILQEPFAAFRLLKALEGQAANPSLRLHPLPPMVEKLDPAYIKPLGEEPAHDAALDFVANLPINSPALTFAACRILDADGRDTSGDLLGTLTGLADLGKNTVYAYARLAVTIGCDAVVIAELDAGGTPFLEVRVSILVTQGDGTTDTEGPFRTHRFSLSRGPGDVIVIDGLTTELSIPISLEHRTTIQARLVNAADTPLNCQGEHQFDPSVTTILPGSFHSITITTTT